MANLRASSGRELKISTVNSFKMYLDTSLDLMLSVFMSIQITVNDFIAEYVTLKQHYFIFAVWYQSGLYSALLQLNGGGGAMMDINTVTEKRGM